MSKVTKSDAKSWHHELTILQEARKRRTLRTIGGVLLTEKQYEEYQHEHCSCCGKRKKEPKEYFGEEFCAECVYKMSQGRMSPYCNDR